MRENAQLEIKKHAFTLALAAGFLLTHPVFAKSKVTKTSEFTANEMQQIRKDHQTVYEQKDLFPLGGDKSCDLKKFDGSSITFTKVKNRGECLRMCNVMAYLNSQPPNLLSTDCYLEQELLMTYLGPDEKQNRRPSPQASDPSEIRIGGLTTSELQKIEADYFAFLRSSGPFQKSANQLCQYKDAKDNLVFFAKTDGLDACLRLCRMISYLHTYTNTSEISTCLHQGQLVQKFAGSFDFKNPNAKFEAWEKSLTRVRETQVQEINARHGQLLALSKGCIACHTLDGKTTTGISFKGLFGKTRTLQGSKKVTANRDYLTRSILDPNKEVPVDFPAGVMPTYQGQLGKAQVESIALFIESLK